MFYGSVRYRSTRAAIVFVAHRVVAWHIWRCPFIVRRHWATRAALANPAENGETLVVDFGIERTRRNANRRKQLPRRDCVSRNSSHVIVDTRPRAMFLVFSVPAFRCDACFHVASTSVPFGSRPRLVRAHRSETYFGRASRSYRPEKWRTSCTSKSTKTCRKTYETRSTTCWTGWIRIGRTSERGSTTAFAVFHIVTLFYGPQRKITLDPIKTHAFYRCRKAATLSLIL